MKDKAIDYVKIILLIGAFCVQWGAMMSKLDNMDNRMIEFITDAKADRTRIDKLEEDVAFMKGQMTNKESKP